MGETNQRNAEEAAREEKLQKERATIAFEHDYFARPGGHGGSTMHVETDETDSADEGNRDQVTHNKEIAFVTVNIFLIVQLNFEYLRESLGKTFSYT